MRRFFSLILFAGLLTACDSSNPAATTAPAPIPEEVRPAPVVASIPIFQAAPTGNQIGTLDRSAIDAALSGVPPAPLSAEVGVPEYDFSPAVFPDDRPPNSIPASPALGVYPNPTSNILGISVSFPPADRSQLYVLPAVTEAGAAPPDITGTALLSTPDGFDGLFLYDGPTAGANYQLGLPAADIGLDYGVYRVVLIADGERLYQDVLYAPCVDGSVAGIEDFCYGP